jgi:Family of unknown function (DUF5647)
VTRDEITRKNLGLLNEFMQCAFEKPNILDQIPPGAELTILPANDSALYQANQETLQALRDQGKRCAVVHIQRPERIPPRIEVAVERC